MKLDRVCMAIVVAMSEEEQPLRAAIRSLPSASRDQVCLLRGGMGARAAQVADRELAGASELRLLCSSGFCGGLVPGLAVGELVLTQQVLAAQPAASTPDTSVVTATPPSPFRPSLEAALTSGAVPWRAGALCNSSLTVFRPNAKLALGQSSGAVAVDLESRALAQLARARGWDFLALRAVSDRVEDELPEAVEGFLTVGGRVRLGRVLRFALHGPGAVRELLRLGRRSAQAARTLRLAWTLALPVLLEGLAAQRP